MRQADDQRCNESCNDDRRASSRVNNPKVEMIDSLPMVALRAMLVALAMLEVGMPVAAFLVCYHPLLAFFAFKSRSV